MLVFVFLFLPYTLLLLFGQWLQAISHLWLFSWVSRLKPFIDSNHASYEAKHRNWLGLYCLYFALFFFLVFALNLWQDPNINLLAIFWGAGIIHVWALLSGGVYKNWCLDVLEGPFVVNLVILSVANYHVSHSGGRLACSWVHLCLHSTRNIHWHSCLPHLPATEAHQGGA